LTPDTVEVLIKRLDDGLPLPKQAYPDDAGLDLFASEDCELAPGERRLVPTGIAIAIPPRYAGFVLPRSGRALKEGLSEANTPGLIDSAFRGELKVVAINHDRTQSLFIKRGERIAQLVILPVPQVLWQEVAELPASERGEQGFGSSGKAGGSGSAPSSDSTTEGA
jgi:dUTP pyrophosphatase